MLTLWLRNKTFYADLHIGRKHPVRRSLGTKNRAAAMSLLYRLETALAQGPQSNLWQELRRVLPPETFTAFANYAGVRDRYTLTCAQFFDIFDLHRNRQVKIGEITHNTRESYRTTLNELRCFIKEQKIEMLKDIDVTTVEKFKIWRADRIKPIRRRASNGRTTLRLNINHLHHMFRFAVDRELVEKNPVRFLTGPWKSKRKNPYTGDEITAMRMHANEDWFLLVLLVSTGLRRSDVAMLLWREVHFDRGGTGEIEHVCKKNGVTVILPLLKELRHALEIEYRRRNPRPFEPVLLIGPEENNTPGLFDRGMEAKKNEAISDSEMRYRERTIYRRIVKLGERAGVENAHPHRFRHYFAVDSMYRGASLTFVARLLGDTEQTVSNDYLSFVQELRDRSRYEIDGGFGLEQLAVAAAHRRHNNIENAA